VRSLKKKKVNRNSIKNTSADPFYTLDSDTLPDRALSNSISNDSLLMDLIANKQTEKIEGIRNAILNRSVALEKILEKYDTFTILSNVSFRYMSFDPEIDTDITRPVRCAFPEYATLLCLKGRYVDGSKEIRFEDFQEIDKILMDIFGYTHFYNFWSESNFRKEGYSPESDTFIGHLIGSELEVRGYAYFAHLFDVLKGLFGPFSETLNYEIGFCVEDVVLLAQGVFNLINKNLILFQQSLIELEEEIRTDTIKFKIGTKGLEDGVLEEKDLEALSKLRPREVSTVIKNSVGKWGTLNLSTAFCFTAFTLAKETGLSQDITEAFLNAFSIEFGGVESDFYFPNPVNRLRKDPIIVKDAQYFCPIALLIHEAIKPKLENVIKNTPSWDRFNKWRHDFLTDKGIGLMKKMMPEAHLEKNLYYSDNPEREPKKFEIDAVCVYDSVLLLIESKAGTMTDRAHEGFRDRVTKDLRELVTNPHLQAERALNHIVSNNEPFFIRDNGEKFSFEKKNIKEIFLVCITLEPLGFLTSALNRDFNFGIISGETYPWVVSIYDLMVISEIIDLPPMFPNYIRRRVRVGQKSLLESQDEIDIFGYYLDNIPGLEQEVELAKDMKVVLSTYTTEFDQYFLYRNGQRKKFSPKPCQYIPVSLKRLLEEITSSNIPGKVSVAMDLLDFSKRARETLNDRIVWIKKRFRKDGKLHNFSLGNTGEGGYGLTAVVTSCVDSLPSCNMGLVYYATSSSTTISS
jgi:hypothetical protein